MSTRPERLVAELSQLRETFDDLAVSFVSDTNPERHPEGSHMRDRAIIRARRFRNAQKARALVERLERLNDRMVADGRKLR